MGGDNRGPQGPPDRLRPVRPPLPHHTPKNRRGSLKDLHRKNRRADRPRAGAALGIQQPVRRGERRRHCRARQRALPGDRHQRRRQARQGRDVEKNQRRRRARPARCHPDAGQKKPLRRRRQPHTAAGRPRHQAQPLRVRGGSAAAAPAGCPRSCPQHPRAGRLDLQGLTRRQKMGSHLQRLPQCLRPRAQPPRRTLHLRRRHGVGLRHAVVPPHPRQPCRQRQRIRLAHRHRQMAGLLPGQPAAGDRHRPGLPHRREVRHRRQFSRNATGMPSISSTGPSAPSTPSTSRQTAPRTPARAKPLSPGSRSR